MSEPSIEVTKEKSQLTDEWEASLVVEHYTHENGEPWCVIYMDNKDGSVREWLEENDEGIHVPYSKALHFFENFQ